MCILKVATSLAMILWAAVKAMEKIFLPDENEYLIRFIT